MADRWLQSLERKTTTVRSYATTLTYAKLVFGRKSVRALQPDDVSRLNMRLRSEGLSASTRAKHLRVLGTCFESAVQHGYAAVNPVRKLPRSEKPRPLRKESAYFENEEIPRLFAELPVGPIRTIFLLALKTGMRQGELLALEWSDIDLIDAVIRVRRSFSGGVVSTPKNHEQRDVDLTNDVVNLLAWWWGECGRPAIGIVFPSYGGSGYISSSHLLRRHLYPAMHRAGVRRIGATGQPRVFHSLRHTYAKRALEGGAPLTWLSRHLGHSSVQITDRVYGHWERRERRQQVARLEGAFGV